MNYNATPTTSIHDISKPNELPFVKAIKGGSSEGRTVKEIFVQDNQWGLDFANECSALYEHVLNSYNYAVTHNLRYSLLDCPADGLISCFLLASKQGLSLTAPHPGYYLKVVESFGGAILCSISYTARGLTQLIGSLGVAKSIYTDVMYENDEWAIMGADQKVHHKITSFDENERGSVACAYATAAFEDGTFLTVHVTNNELMAAEEAANEYALQNGEASLWKTAYANEIRKTKPIYRLWKELQPQITRLRKKGLLNKEDYEMAKNVASSVSYDAEPQKTPMQTSQMN